MALEHANPGDVIDVRPLGDRLESSRTTTLVKTDTLEIIRLVLPAGKNIPEHQAPGLLTVQCLEGRVAFTAGGNEIDLEPGRLIYLNEREPHAVRALVGSSLLLTLYSPQS